MQYRLSALALAMTIALARPAAATPESKTTEQAEEEPSKAESKPGLLAATAAIIPGAIVHGFGHYIAGDKKTAYKLFKWQMVGLGMMVAGGAALGLSGGSRYGNEASIPLLVGGTGLFLNTMVADLYGSASGGTKRHYSERPRQQASLGYAYIHDPIFSYSHFSVASADIRWRSFGMAPSLWVALDDDNQRARIPLRYRWPLGRAGEYIEAETAATYHNFGEAGFSSYVGEASANARLELSRVGETLQGSFVKAGLGYGAHQVRYRIADVKADTTGLLVGHFGFGLYLPGSGELEALYEQRRDDFTSGTSPSPRNGSGFLGHFTLRLRQPISDRFALRVASELGAAWLISGMMEVRLGGLP
jgi:hypothetical protein